MTKLLMVGLVVFIVALVLPELRPLLFVGVFCLVTGSMVGSQQTARHTAKLHAHRAQRVSMRTMEA